MPGQKEHLNYLIDVSFQEVNRLFILLFEDNTVRTTHTRYFLPKKEIKDCIALIDGKDFDQPVKYDMKTFDNIQKNAPGQGDDYTTRYILEYLYFKEYYEMIAIDLSKQQKIDADPKINFTGNPHQPGNTTMFFIIKKPKALFQIFHKEL